MQDEVNRYYSKDDECNGVKQEADSKFNWCCIAFQNMQ